MRCRALDERLWTCIVSRCIVTLAMELRPASYFVLASLLDGPLHGYAIASRAAELSDGEVRLTAGTLYGALERMTGQGLVQADREEVVDGRLRRYYRLSDQGRDAVVGEADRLAAAAKVVRRRRPAVVKRAAWGGG
jgi:PadR family transcriptional regulator PadR